MFYGFQRWREAFFLACVFGLPELGLLWCLAFSDPLPTSFIFVSVQVIGCLSATFRTQPRSEGAGHKKCFMDSKGDGKHFFWLVFLACLSSACCGVWPFRIRCPRASFLCLCRLSVAYLLRFGPSLAARVLATRNVLWIPKVTGSIFSGLCFWLAWARPVVVFGLFGSVAHELHFCVCAGYRLLICYVSDPASQRGCWPQEMFYGFQRWREAFFLACVFGLPELGLLWCLAFSDPLPTSLIFVSVQVIGCLSATFRTQPRSEGAGHKKCFMDSKGDGKHFFWLVFLACLSSACCGVWPFRIRCPRASFLCLCRL